jgi:hypothetical protein
LRKAAATKTRTRVIITRFVFILLEAKFTKENPLDIEFENEANATSLIRFDESHSPPLTT